MRRAANTGGNVESVGPLAGGHAIALSSDTVFWVATGGEVYSVPKSLATAPRVPDGAAERVGLRQIRASSRTLKRRVDFERPTVFAERR